MTVTNKRSSSFVTRWSWALASALVLLYVAIAYGLMPIFWTSYERRHPAFEQTPTLTHTRSGVPGDPINVALIASEDDVLRIMKAANWMLAARLGIRADLWIAADTAFGRPDPNAPVSDLYLFGRREDLAFEQEVGNSPRSRHHVRFWKIDQKDSDRPVWIGAAVFDRRVGLSHTTGQVTHIIAAAIDDERNFLFECLKKTGDLLESYAVDGYHDVLQGKNGDGNAWQTDGRLFVGVVKQRARDAVPPAQ
jgi:LssY C-terminus